MNPINHIVIVDNEPLYIKGLRSAILENFGDVVVTPINSLSVALEQMDYRDTLFIISLKAIEASLKLYRDFMANPRDNAVIVLIGNEFYQEEVLPPSVICHDWFRRQDTELKAINAIKNILEMRSLGEHPELQTSQSKKKDSDHSPRAKGLSERESDLLFYLVQGLSNKEIGKKLYLSEKTIKNNMTRLYRKIHVTNRVEAAAYAMKEFNIKGELK